MASQSPRKSSTARPSAPRVSSYSHQTSQDGNADRVQPPKRSQTMQDGPKSTQPQQADAPDAFDTGEHTDTEDGPETTRASIELDILPIELVTVTDSFIESLNARVNPTPPTIEKLSQRFQDFYAQASSHISTHVNALATRQSRDASPAASSTSISSAANRLRSKASSLSTTAAKEKPKTDAEQQMITSDELADRKKARRALEAKRVLLEEAVERRLCEGIYDRIYRHKSTQDEAQDDKLRSKTAALALVGIGPADLGVDLDEGDAAEPSSEGSEEKTNDTRSRLEPARKDLVRMYTSKYPLGKLNHLKAAHRSIVDTIAHFHPSASADEIMPMLIYTLITLPPEDLNVISDVHFIQNFRWAPKLTGEAAYCLTNLEAAISFLETVDLATLRSDEHPSGPPKNQPGTPKTETFPPAYPQGLTAPASQSTPETTLGTATASKPSTSPSGLKAANVLRNRRLSDLVNTPAQAFGAASDAMFNTADQIKTISTSLGDSYKFFLGKVRERQDGQRMVPRTLDDARKLVSTPSPEEEGALILSAEETEGLRASTTSEDRVLTLLAGKRDHSADSTVSGRSAGSARRLFSNEDNKTPAATPPAGQNNPAVLDQVRTFSNSFNPMARLSSMNVMRGFGRNAPTPQADGAKAPVADGGDLATAFPDIAAALPPKPAAPKIAPPNKRYMELQNPGDLRLSEVLDLLRDYRRLAGALKNLDAFEEK